MRRKRLKLLGLIASDESWRTLSYAASLPRAVARHPAFDLSLVNIAKPSRFDLAALVTRLRFGSYDAIVLFHSTFSNANYVSPSLVDRIAASGRPVVLFLGNEYKLMPEKMDFARRLGVALLVTQISRAPVHALYRAALGCDVMFLPNATFDPDNAPPLQAERPIDIGYRAYGSVFYLGHDDRERIANLMTRPAEDRGFKTDISLDPEDRLDETQWKEFLRRCRAQLGTESGSDSFELTDETRLAVNVYCNAHPQAPFEDIKRVFFADGVARVSGRTISSRHLEAAAARCVQILFEGEFGGIFDPDVHYIALARDGTNVDSVLDRLADQRACAEVADAAFAASERFAAPRMMSDFESALRGICE